MVSRKRNNVPQSPYIGVQERKNSHRSQVVALSYNVVSGEAETDNAIASNNSFVAFPTSITNAAVAPVVVPEVEQIKRPHLVAIESPEQEKKKRQSPLLVKANRAMQTVLVGLCGIAILAYGFDVVASHEVGAQQDLARRLSEQNSELSAQLLKTISYGELQNGLNSCSEALVGRSGLRVPDQVQVIKAITPPTVKTFSAQRHHLPIMTGY
ncbi:MAG: hypothetical protein KIT34_18770 [Cyanobacteria bacterium TGS_CYA1]|nr:hypothetical protein [Cyanobacteria bacterium TGS_CYA1]